MAKWLECSMDPLQMFNLIQLYLLQNQFLCLFSNIALLKTPNHPHNTMWPGNVKSWSWFSIILFILKDAPRLHHDAATIMPDSWYSGHQFEKVNMSQPNIWFLFIYSFIFRVWPKKHFCTRVKCVFLLQNNNPKILSVFQQSNPTSSPSMFLILSITLFCYTGSDWTFSTCR